MPQPAEHPADLADSQTSGQFTRIRRLWFGLIILMFLCVITAPFYVDTVAHNAPIAKNGTLSFAGWGKLNRPVQLRGDWTLIWKSRLGTHPAGTTAPLLQRMPGRWEGLVTPGGDRLPQQGRATYQLIIKDLPRGDYRLFERTTYSATRITINGEALSQRGTLGDDKAATRYFARAQDVSFRAGGGDVVLTIDVASFLHRDSGIDDVPVLGLAEPVQYWIALNWGREFLFHTALVLLGIFGLAVFLFRRSDRPSLYLAIACFLFLAPSAVEGFDNLFMMAFPNTSFSTMLVIHYISTIAALAFFLAYAHALFPRESPQRSFRIILAIIGVLLIVQIAGFLIGGTLLASQVNVGLLVVMLLVFFYVLIILVRAVARSRDGAVIFLLGMALFFVSITMLAIVAYGFVQPDRMIGYDYTGYGILILVFSHMIVLAERWAAAIYAAEQMNDDLRQLLDVNLAITTEMQLEALLKKIVEVASKILHADRSSLFIFDAKTDELWSMVAEGLSTRQIRFPAGEGLAGHALQTGETINIADAYTDPRFIRRMDIETGYQTRSVLSMPVIARDGRRLGVMQALNHHGSQQFSSEDAAKMSAFAAQAAIAIDNATLFSEVVSSRNYNENILRSMSSGVITLDCDDLIIKINKAAAAIFGVRAESVQGTDLRAFLMHANPQSIARIDEVIESGQSKTLFDIDITTAEGAVVSANVSIVPLMSDGARQGLMILIEDISQGKRLEGAMRRFMTQNVVDQVLGREDELLFGTACRASILFADIRNFTSMAEDLPPRATVDMLNEIFTELFEAVAGQGGVLDKYIGDALMAVYGAPISTANDPANAVASAIQMQAMIDTINVGRRAQGAAELRLGIGIASGDVVAGTIGSPKRMDYTVIGDSVNLAARLEAATKFYGIDIIICEHTAALCGTMHLRQLDLIRVRGRHEPSKIFQVLTQSLSGSGLSADMITAYEQGRTHLERRRWDDAIAAFETALIHDPNDQPCAIMLRRARILAATPPGDEWDGIWHSPGTIRPV